MEDQKIDMKHKHIISGLKKISAWYTPAMDIAAGIDPTGTSTFRLASKYKKGHTMHRTLGDIGGFVGGSILGAALPAAAIGGTALALRGRSPRLAKEFGTAMKGSLDVLNPKALVRHFKSIPAILGYKREAMKMMRRGRRVGRQAAGFERMTQAVRSGSRIPNTAREKRRLLQFAERGKRFGAQQEAVQKMEQDISRRFYGGRPIEIGRTMTALTTIPAALTTGALNLSSAHMQYGEARKQATAKLRNQIGT